MLQQLKDKIAASHWTDEEKLKYLDAFYTRLNVVLLEEIYKHANPALKRKLESLSDNFSIEKYLQSLAEMMEDASSKSRLESVYTKKLEEELLAFPS